MALAAWISHRPVSVDISELCDEERRVLGGATGFPLLWHVDVDGFSTSMTCLILFLQYLILIFYFALEK